MKKITIFFPLIILMGSQLNGYNKEQLGQFKKTYKCPGCDLSKANIQGIRPDDGIINLKGANLTQSILIHWDSNINLKGADLTKALLSYINSGTGNKDFNAEGAIFNKAHIRAVNFRDANLKNAKFEDATFEYTNTFDGADLTGTSFKGVKPWEIWGGLMPEPMDVKTAIKDAHLCNTIMPDGSKNDRDCKVVASTSTGKSTLTGKS